MVKKSEPAKNLTLTELADQRIWLSARASLLIVALVSAVPTPLSVMWGRTVRGGYQDFLWPILVACLWAISMAVGQLRYLSALRAKAQGKQQADTRSLVIGLLFDTSFLTACLYLGGATRVCV